MKRKDEIKELISKSGLSYDFIAQKAGLNKDELLVQLNRSLKMPLEIYVKLKAVLEPFVQVGEEMEDTTAGQITDARLAALEKQTADQQAMLDDAMKRIEELEKNLK